MSFFTWFQMVSVVMPTACFFLTCSVTFCFNSSSESAFPCHLQAWSASLHLNWYATSSSWFGPPSSAYHWYGADRRPG